jgi:hypothetical protein
MKLDKDTLVAIYYLKHGSSAISDYNRVIRRIERELKLMGFKDESEIIEYAEKNKLIID